MPNYKVAKLSNGRGSFRCQSCDKYGMSKKMYKYQSVSYVKGYEPFYFTELCGDCIYRMVFGTKNYKKEKKNGSLDK